MEVQKVSLDEVIDCVWVYPELMRTVSVFEFRKHCAYDLLFSSNKPSWVEAETEARWHLSMWEQNAQRYAHWERREGCQGRDHDMMRDKLSWGLTMREAEEEDLQRRIGEGAASQPLGNLDEEEDEVEEPWMPSKIVRCDACSHLLDEE